MVVVYVLVDGLYYPGVFSTPDRAEIANTRWYKYCGRKAQVINMSLNEFVLDKYEDHQQ